MDFRQMEAFIKVVENSSFSKAAEVMHISQPSVSAYVSSLEKELDTVLINRSTKTMSLTLAGSRFLDKAREMMALRHESVEMLKNLSGDISGDIRILASSVPAMYILPQKLAAFHQLYPEVAFSMVQTDTAQVVQGIAAQEADIGFAGSFLGGKKCSFIEFTHERLVFIAPNDGSYTEGETYTLEDLLYSNCFIARKSGSGTRIQYEKYFEENGILLDRIKTCASMDSTFSIVNAVMNGLGVSIVSELALSQPLAQGLLLRLKLASEPPERKIYAVLNSQIVHSHLIELFMKFLLQDTPASPGA